MSADDRFDELVGDIADPAERERLRRVHELLLSVEAPPELSTERGEAPALIAVTHPASYGPYKLDLLHQMVRQAGLLMGRGIDLIKGATLAVSGRFVSRGMIELNQPARGPLRLGETVAQHRIETIRLNHGCADSTGLVDKFSREVKVHG